MIQVQVESGRLMFDKWGEEAFCGLTVAKCVPPQGTEERRKNKVDVLSCLIIHNSFKILL